MKFNILENEELNKTFLVVEKETDDIVLELEGMSIFRYKENHFYIDDNKDTSELKEELISVGFEEDETISIDKNVPVIYYYKYLNSESSTNHIIITSKQFFETKGQLEEYTNTLLEEEMDLFGFEGCQDSDYKLNNDFTLNQLEDTLTKFKYFKFEENGNFANFLESVH